MRTSITLRQGLAAAGLLAVGGMAGGVAGHATRPSIEMAPARPVPIKSLAGGSGIVSVRARVAERYGDAFVADDGTARTLVELGRGDDGADLVAAGQTVTVQGRFDRGVLRASFLVDAAGEVHAIGPEGRGRRGPGGPGRDGPDRDGPGGRHGPDDAAGPDRDRVAPAADQGTPR